MRARRSMLSSLLALASAWGSCLAAAPGCVATDASPRPASSRLLRLDDADLHLEEAVTVRFDSPGEWRGRAWVGLFRADTVRGKAANGKELAYKYVEDLPERSWPLSAPTAAGNYEFRLQDDTGEVDRVAFSVRLHTEGACLEIVGDDRAYPGTPIRARYRTPSSYAPRAWIGVFRADTPRPHAEANNQEIGYQYLEASHSGVYEAQAPAEPGSYELRLYERAHFVTAVPFEVALLRGAASLSVEAVRVHPRRKVNVAFTAPKFFPPNAWVGVFRADTPRAYEEANNKELSYQKLTGKTEGRLEFTSPGRPGHYEFRMLDLRHEVVALPFQVAHLAGGTSLEVLAVEPEVEVRFRAPGHFDTRAWVGVLPAEAPHGYEANNLEDSYQYLEGRTEGTLKFRRPHLEKSWEVRLFDRAWDGNDGLLEVLAIPLRPGARAAVPADPAPAPKSVRAPPDRMSLAGDAPEEAEGAAGVDELRDDLDTSALEAELAAILTRHGVRHR